MDLIVEKVNLWFGEAQFCVRCFGSNMSYLLLINFSMESLCISEILEALLSALIVTHPITVCLTYFLVCGLDLIQKTFLWA